MPMIESSKMLLVSDESGSLVKSKSQSGPRSIKFTVRTKGQSDDKPIELEIEIKDQVRILSDASLFESVKLYLMIQKGKNHSLIFYEDLSVFGKFFSTVLARPGIEPTCCPEVFHSFLHC